MRDATSKTIERAALSGNTNQIASFLAAGGDVNFHLRPMKSAPQDWETPLHCAARAAQENVLSLLLEHGAAVNATNWHGRTPIHEAVTAEAPQDTLVRIVRRLIDARADVNASTYNGCRALDLAQALGRSDLVVFLKQHGASPGIENTTGNK
jgi:ankyrin repeat protein